jgi:putative oxidoreductase
MFQRLIRTDNSIAPLLLRLALGIVMFAHGAQKIFGWFGGNGIDGTMQYFTASLGIPGPLAFVALWVELLCGIALVVGVLTRVAALGIAIQMIVAALLVHLPYGFFMNWMGQQQGEGFEYHILAVAMGLALMVLGGGAFSVDRALTKERSELEHPPTVRMYGTVPQREIRA